MALRRMAWPNVKHQLPAVDLPYNNAEAKVFNLLEKLAP
jgi:hypothetical protein